MSLDICDQFNQLVKSYYLMSEPGKTITVGIGFAHFNLEAEPILKIDGKVYERGSIVAIPSDYAGSLCSMREYCLKKRQDLQI